MGAQRTRGRPKSFDTDEVLDKSINIFWRDGLTGTTTRTLEQELGLSQSSIYNTFGSKDQLFEKVVERYQNNLDDAVLVELTGPGADKNSIINFLDALTTWIQHKEHPGCLVLNLALEADGDNGLRVKAYRTRLRRLLKPALRTFTTTTTEIEARTELLITAILGLNISARSNASQAELRKLAGGIKFQVTSWA